jgi:hypothetical protein
VGKSKIGRREGEKKIKNKKLHVYIELKEKFGYELMEFSKNRR